MSTTQNLLYSAVQVAHNFGAVAAVGGAAGGSALKEAGARRKLAVLSLCGWLAQALSGATFGAVSYYYYHRFPDIGDIATDALAVKMGCVTAALALFAAYLAWGRRWPEHRANLVWLAALALAAAALSAAAVLRWFS